MSNMPKSKPKRENPFINLLLNIAVPTIILMKFSGPEELGARLGLIVALLFPITYGVFDYFRIKKINFFSALGVFSILMTGGIALLELDPKYIAIKEAGIPALIAIAFLVTLKTRSPLIKLFLYNDNLLQTARIEQSLEDNGNSAAFERTFFNATAMIAASFTLSSVLNYLLAKWVVVSAPGTEAFNEELGRMMALSYPVIAIPSLILTFGILFYLVRRIMALTGLKFEQILVDMDNDSEEPQAQGDVEQPSQKQQNQAEPAASKQEI